MEDMVFRTSFRILCDRRDSEAVTRDVLMYAAANGIVLDGNDGAVDRLLRQTCVRSRLRIMRRRLLWLLDIRNNVYVGACPVADDEDDYVTKQAWQLYCRAVFRMTPLQVTVYALCALGNISIVRASGILFLSEAGVCHALEKAAARIRLELAAFDSADMYQSFTDFIRKVH